MEKSALFRLSESSLTLHSDFTATQNMVDGMVRNTFVQGTDWKTFLPIVGGGYVNRWVKLGLLSTSPNLFNKIPLLVRGASVAALGVESAAFEVAHRGITSLTQPSSQIPPTLWTWSGHHGLKEGWLHSFTTFGTLKGFGVWGEGQNIIFQHGAQALGMVAGHQLVYLAGWGEKPEGSFAEQVFQAEGVNLTLAGGMAIFHMGAPGLHAMERGWDLALRARENGTGFSRPHFMNGETPLLQTSGSPFSSRTRPSRTRDRGVQEAKDLLNLMAGENGEGNGEPPSSRKPGLPPTTPEEGRRRGEEALAKLAEAAGGDGDYIRSQMALILHDAFQQGQILEIKARFSQGTAEAPGPRISSKDWNHIEAYRIVAEESGYEIGRPEEIGFDPPASKVFLPIRKITRSRGEEAPLSPSPLTHSVDPHDPALPPPAARRLEGAPPQALPPAAPAVEPVPALPEPPRRREIERTVMMGPLLDAFPAPKTPAPAFVAFIGDRDWVMDFNQHPFFYLAKGEKDIYRVHDEGFSIAPDVPPGARGWGTFFQRGYEIFFQSVDGSSFQAVNARTPLFAHDPEVTPQERQAFRPLRPGRHFNEKLGARVDLRSLTQLLMLHLEPTLAEKSGGEGKKISDSLRDLTQALAAKEREERKGELHQIRGREYHWTMMEVALDFGAPQFRKSPYEEAAKGASKEEAALLVSHLIPFLHTPESHVQEHAVDLLKALMPKMSHMAQSELVPSILESHFKFPKDLLWTAYGLARKSPLEILLGPISIVARLAAFRQMTERLAGGSEVTQENLGLLELFAGNIPTGVLAKEGKTSSSRPVRLLAQAYAKGLPLVKPIYDRYINSPDPENYLDYALARISFFLYGGPLVEKTNNDYIAFAYGALDNPEQLTYEQFARKLRFDGLPKPFIPDPFRVEVPLVRVAHADVDKGVLQKAYTDIAKVYSLPLFVDYLREVLGAPKKNGLVPLRGELEQVAAVILGKDKATLPELAAEISSENVLNVAERLLPLLSASEKTLKPQGKDVFKNLVVGLASAGETGQRLVPVIATYNDKVSPETLVAVLSALREFYSQGVPEILKDSPAKIPALDQHAESLKKAAEKVESAVESTLSIEMVPSKSQTDAFAGYVGEDCTKPHWPQEIKTLDAQVYRMVVDKRLQGMVYLKRDIVDGQVVLVVGIEPRARFRVSHKDLLDGVIRELGKVAEKYDYDKILISTDSHQRSNRPDMNDAIDKRFEGIPPINFQQSVSGPIFKGHTFHVAWTRPPGLEKGPPPPDSIGKIAAPEAQTVMLGTALPGIPPFRPPSRR